MISSTGWTISFLSFYSLCEDRYRRNDVSDSLRLVSFLCLFIRFLPGFFPLGKFHLRLRKIRTPFHTELFTDTYARYWTSCRNHYTGSKTKNYENIYSIKRSRKNSEGKEKMNFIFNKCIWNRLNFLDYIIKTNEKNYQQYNISLSFE